MPGPVSFIHCSVEGCDASYKANYWAQIKAHEEGWFMKRNGVVFCPEHVPDWVPAWRERQKEKKEN